MRACLTCADTTGYEDLLDYGYFYYDSGSRGWYTCGLARQAMITFLRANAEMRVFLDQSWLESLDAFRDNPSVIGFIVEQMVISQLADNGLSKNSPCLKQAKVLTFPGNHVALSPLPGTRLYVPQKFNLKAIDALYTSIEGKVATIVPIQITIGTHEDTEKKFFQDWWKWIDPIESRGFTMKTCFLWINREGGQREEVLEDKRETREVTKVVCPSYTRVFVPIRDVHLDLGTKLDDIKGPA